LDFFISSSILAQKTTNPLKGKKVLFVYGGWEGHDPVLTRDIFVLWMRSEGAEVVVRDNLDCYTDSALMSKTDLIVQIWTMGEISNEQERGLLAAVKRGVGLQAGTEGLVMHLGTMLNINLWWAVSGSLTLAVLSLMMYILSIMKIRLQMD